MFTKFIKQILGAERRSVSNRLENAAPSVIVKKGSTEPIPEKYKKDIAALQEKYGNLSSLTRTLYQPNSQRSPGNHATKQKKGGCL